MATKKGAEQKRRLLGKSEKVWNFSDSKLIYVFYLFIRSVVTKFCTPIMRKQQLTKTKFLNTVSISYKALFPQLTPKSVCQYCTEK
jgi:hypothetical protein